MRFSLRYGRSEREVVVGVYVVGGGLRLDVDEGGVGLVILEQRFFFVVFIFSRYDLIDLSWRLNEKRSLDSFC